MGLIKQSGKNVCVAMWVFVMHLGADNSLRGSFYVSRQTKECRLVVLWEILHDPTVVLRAYAHICVYKMTTVIVQMHTQYKKTLRKNPFCDVGEHTTSMKSSSIISVGFIIPGLLRIM